MKKIYELGLFETMRSINGKIVYFKEHLERLKKSAKLVSMEFPYTFARLKGMLARALEINKYPDACVKLILLGSAKSTDCLIIVKRYKPYSAIKYTRGFSAIISRVRQQDIFLAQLKSTSRLLYERAQEEAKAKGFNEAIILNKKGNLAEASKANIFFVLRHELFTPALLCGCLNGITRKAIMDLAKIYKIKVNEGNFPPQDLLGSDEAFLTNSLIGVMPLRKIGKKRIGKGKNKLTQFFRQKYLQLVDAD